MNPSTIVFALLLQVVLILLNGIFSAAEIAVISANGAKMEKLAEEGNKSAKRILKLTAIPSKFLSTIQVSITLAGFAGSAFAADSFAEPLATAIYQDGWVISKDVIQTLCVILITLILSFFSIVFGELVPKRLAMKNAEKLSLHLSGILTFVSHLFAPIVWLLTVTSNGVLRLFGIKAEDDGEQVTEEEIMLMAETGSEKGSIEERENEFIQNIFDFKENDVGEVCTHRKDVDMLFERDSDEQWNKTIEESYHSFYPVCGKDVDDVVGILNTKIYFRLKDKSRDNVMKNAVVDPVFISETLPADDLFYRMQSTREYFAVVLDEYGGVSGIITLHDLLELLVGDINEKGETPEYEVVKLADDQWEIRGLAPFDEVAEEIGLEMDEDDKEDYETFAGYVCELLGEVPDDGETAHTETEQLIIDVLEVADHRVEKMRITKKQKPAEPDEEENDKDEDKDEKKFKLFKPLTDKKDDEAEDDKGGSDKADGGDEKEKDEN